MHNPRWPHTLKGYREMLDENGDPVTDENGDIVRSLITFDVIEYDGQWNPRKNPDGTFKVKRQTSLPWGYRTATGGIKDSGEVFKTDFKVSTPMFFNHLEEGIVLWLTDYTHTFSAVVKKCTTYNWGTNIWFDISGNDGKLG